METWMLIHGGSTLCGDDPAGLNVPCGYQPATVGLGRQREETLAVRLQ